MRIYLGADHAGFSLKNHLLDHLTTTGHAVIDVRAHENDAGDDYPPYCLETARRVVADAGSLGIVIGGSGNGEQIATNKVEGARACLVWSVQTATLAREYETAARDSPTR